MRHLSDRKKTDFQPHVQPHLPLLHCDACVVPMSWSHDSYPGQDQESMTRSECHVARQKSEVVAEQTLIQARLPHRPHTEVYVRRRAIPCRDGVEAGYMLEGRSPLWDVCASLRATSAKARRAVPSCPPRRSQLRQGHPKLLATSTNDSSQTPRLSRINKPRGHDNSFSSETVPTW